MTSYEVIICSTIFSLCFLLFLLLYLRPCSFNRKYRTSWRPSILQVQTDIVICFCADKLCIIRCVSNLYCFLMSSGLFYKYVYMHTPWKAFMINLASILFTMPADIDFGIFFLILQNTCPFSKRNPCIQINIFFCWWCSIF